MNQLTKKVRKCAKLGGGVWVATSDRQGLPHLAISKTLEVKSAEEIVLSGWLCLKTVDNLRENDAIAIGMWCAGSEEGYQLIGKVSKIEVSGMTRGKSRKGTTDLSQTEYRLTVQVKEILHLLAGQHSDFAV